MLQWNNDLGDNTRLAKWFKEEDEEAGGEDHK